MYSYAGKFVGAPLQRPPYSLSKTSNPSELYEGLKESPFLGDQLHRGNFRDFHPCSDDVVDKKLFSSFDAPMSTIVFSGPSRFDCVQNQLRSLNLADFLMISNSDDVVDIFYFSVCRLFNIKSCIFWPELIPLHPKLAS